MGKCILDVLFGEGVKDTIGMGAEWKRNYSFRGIRIQSCRIHIEPEKAIPLSIACGTAQAPEDPESLGPRWTFDPDFYEVDGGYAPRILRSDHPESFDERQEFQVVNGIWIYKSGESWYGESSVLGSGPIQSIDLVDLDAENIAGTPNR